MCFIIFSPVLDNFFLLDDGQWLERGKSAVEGAGGLFQWVGGGAYFEPVLNCIFAVYFFLFGLHPAGYYAMNIFLHAVNAALVYRFSLVLAPRDRAGACFASLMFVVLYAHHQPVLWIAAFVHLVSAMFLMICFILFAQYARTRRAAYYVLSLAGFVVCLLTKESTVMLPVAMLAYFSFFPGRASNPVKWQSLIPFLILSFLCFSFYLLRGISWQTKVGGFGYTLGLHFLPALASSWLEILLTTLGAATFFGKPEGERALFLNAALLMLLFVSSIVFSKRESELEKIAWKNILFGVLFFFLMLLPFSFFQESAGYGSFHRYRYLYLPSVGFCLSFGCFLSFLMREIMRMKKLQWRLLIFAGVVFNILYLNANYVRKAETYYSLYGRTSKNVLNQIGALIADKKPGKLYLIDFPDTPILAMSQPHIISLVRLTYGKEWQVSMLREPEMEKIPPDKSVRLVYRDGRIQYDSEVK